MHGRTMRGADAPPPLGGTSQTTRRLGRRSPAARRLLTLTLGRNARKAGSIGPSGLCNVHGPAAALPVPCPLSRAKSIRKYKASHRHGQQPRAVTAACMRHHRPIPRTGAYFRNGPAWRGAFQEGDAVAQALPPFGPCRVPTVEQACMKE